MMEQNSNGIQRILFEEDYLIRTVGPIAHLPEVALTELVANAWDAGATEVRIKIPDDYNNDIIVEDDGCGMTPEQFKVRWMTLGYNRTKHQGRKAEFPPERNNWPRMAFGLNGVGRHGLFCFANQYEVDTYRDNIGTRFLVATSSGNQPVVLLNEETIKAKTHGTRLKARIERHLTSADYIREVLSARFLHDPKFTVFVNGDSVPLTDLPGRMDQRSIKINDKVTIEIIFIESPQPARTTKHQGVAFWVGGRLVGEPSWTLGSHFLIDGRTRLAKKYTAVVISDDLFDEVLPDWSGFNKSDLMERVHEEVDNYVKVMFQTVAADRIQETKETVLREHIDDIEQLQPLARHEVAQFVEEFATGQPTIQTETISYAVQTMIKLEQSHSGASLLEKLSKLSEEDIEGLDRLLNEWTIRDALTVLDEIDRRIATIEAIKKLEGEKKTDELHTLHPLVTQARWIFGPAFDSAEYSSNISLRKAVKKVFGDRLEKDAFVNSRKRPDLIILKDASLSAVCLEGFDDQGTLTTMRNVLLIELKRGASTIGRNEMHQASDYVQDLQRCGLLDGTPFIKAFVVGHRIDSKVEEFQNLGKDPVIGSIEAITYGRLVRTGEARLFKLRENLQERYDEIKGTDLLARIMSEPKQPSLFSKPKEKG